MVAIAGSSWLYSASMVVGRDDETEEHPELRATNGPRVAVFWEGGGVSKALPATGALSFGRALDCDVPIDHKSVSRRHAVLHLGGAQMFVEDLGSANGTRVRGRSLGAGERVRVEAGDVVELGATMLVVQRGPMVARAAAPAAPLAGAPANDVVVAAPAMRELHRLVGLVAASGVSVLVRGETGVGKDVVAGAIHRASPRRGGPLVCLNCAALPEALLESELFGHEKGAFTGADQPRAGIFEAATGGTIFLDEVGETSLGTQAKLLRVVESRTVTRLGSVRPIPVDVRLVAATNRDLESLIAEGRFRQDLYFRLNGVTLTVPPLRERTEEIVPLAEHFIAQAAREAGTSAPTLATEAREALVRYGWPGNVRELKNAIGQAMIFREGAKVIGLAHLPAAIQRGLAAAAATSAPPDAGLRGEVDAFERARIVAALEQCSGNQTRAAALLGISRRTLLSRLDAYGLPRPRK